jgi:hypothetical protein
MRKESPEMATGEPNKMGCAARVAVIGVIGSILALAVPLAEVHKIFIGKIGGPDGDRFALLLADELTKHGFVVADADTGVDGILTGAESTVMYGTKPFVNATMVLKDASGTLLWQQNIAPKTSLSVREPLHSRAIDVAERLQKACSPAKTRNK